MIKLLSLAALLAIATATNTSCTTQKKPSLIYAEVHLITGEKLSGNVPLSCLMGEGKVLAYKKCSSTEECGSLIQVGTKLSMKSDSKAPLELTELDCPHSLIQVKIGSRIRCVPAPKKDPTAPQPDQETTQEGVSA
mmetsp:Transcript_25612/g.44768  ORF Transcript_25612/g.44768 Transcript_25612/m.44768 type:complete len:136 (+) Transcript_25612:322-729(+)